MTRRLKVLAAAAGTVLAVLAPAGCSGAPRPTGSGIRAADLNHDVRAQDGLFEYANGEWVRSTEVPEDRVEVGPVSDVAARVEEQEHALLEDASRALCSAYTCAPPGVLRIGRQSKGQQAPGPGSEPETPETQPTETPPTEPQPPATQPAATQPAATQPTEPQPPATPGAQAADPQPDAHPAPAALTRQIGDLYASFMDTARVDGLRATPMDIDFAAVDKLVNAADVTNYLGILRSIDVPTPIGLDVEPDRRDTAVTIAVAEQGGLTMPGRDDYLAADQRSVQLRTAYRAYVAKMLALAGTPDPRAGAATVLDLETRLAALQWTDAQNGDGDATYNRFPVAEARARTGIDWQSYLDAADADAHDLVIAQPSYFAGLGALLNTVPLPSWKTYLRWRLLESSAPYLSSDFVDTQAAFNATVPGMADHHGPRWRRGVAAVNAAMGDGLGQLYAERYCPAAVTDRVQAIADKVVQAYQRDISKLDWMSPRAKAEAQAKLSRMQVAVGTPHEFKDWSLLEVSRDDLLGNIRRAANVRVGRQLETIGNRADDRDWGSTTTQDTTVRYDRIRNALIVPAGALQPPFFDVDAEDAVNYGSIGALMAHEISHGFDDRGRFYDAAGTVRDWWTPADATAYAAKVTALEARADGVGLPPGYAPKLTAYPQAPTGEDARTSEQPPIPDERTTVSEAVADLSGAAMAANAYRSSLGHWSSPVIDGFTGPQRFWLGYARLWRVKPRDQTGYVDPNDPARFRTDAVVDNLDGFYDAWDVKPGDLAYLPPAQRIRFW